MNYKRILRKLRKIGQNQILNRIALFKEDAYASNDIFTNLLKSHGKSHLLLFDNNSFNFILSE
jgi:hypothetical protein